MFNKIIQKIQLFTTHSQNVFLVKLIQRLERAALNMSWMNHITKINNFTKRKTQNNGNTCLIIELISLSQKNRQVTSRYFFALLFCVTSHDISS